MVGTAFNTKLSKQARLKKLSFMRVSVVSLACFESFVLNLILSTRTTGCHFPAGRGRRINNSSSNIGAVVKIIIL
jgi:hypothetical protein